MWRELMARELGAIRPARLSSNYNARMLHSLELSTHKEVLSVFDGGIYSLQVDSTEGRYLLAGSSDGSVGCYDTIQHSDFDLVSNCHRHASVFKLDRTVPKAHKFAVSSVQWYPVDTGLFVTGSLDKNVNVWDTNNSQVELQFPMPAKVRSVSMSPAASSHMLIAVGSDDPMVRLCDIGTGACTHTLVGHRDAVLAVRWSISCEWTLYSGGCDGAIRFWDVRRAGSYRVLNQDNSQMGRRPPVRKSQAGRGRSATGEHDMVAPAKYLKTGSSGKSSAGSLQRAKSKGLDPVAARRVHPGLASVENHATAHNGSVISLIPTNDGQFLVSAGSDSRVKLWDVQTGCDTLVNFENARLQRTRAIQLGMSSDSSLLFVPISTIVQVYSMSTGRLLKSLRGHYDAVNCCEFHPHEQEMYSGSNDRKLLVWTPPNPSLILDDEEKVKGGSGTRQYESRADEDAWSD